MAVDVLDHDDGVVDDEANAEHQREQRKQIDRVAERQKIVNVPTSDSGMATVGISDDLTDPRNMNTTSVTMTSASTRLSTTS